MDDDRGERDDDGDDDAAGNQPTAPAYYYAPPGRSALGPCTIPQLKVLWMSGHIDESTTLWQEGMAAWTAVRELPVVHSALRPLKQPPRQDTTNVWYYLDAAGRHKGGVTAAQMGLLLRQGEVDGLTHVWRQGQAQWAELGSVSELREQLQQTDADDDEEENLRREAMYRAAQQVAYDPEAEAFVPAPPRPAATAAASSGIATLPAPANNTSHSGPCGHSAASGSGGGDGHGGDTASGRDKKKKKKKSFVSKAGSNVYVSNLPADVTPEELGECLKVAGVLRTDPATCAARIKMYTAPDGTPKGDALVSFLKVESVALAVTLRDGFEIRPSAAMRVQPAKFEKREGDDTGDGGGGGGERRLGKDEAQARKRQRLVDERALAEWDAGLLSGKRNTTIVLTNLFDAAMVTAAAVAEGDDGSEAAFYANLGQDVEAECRKAGAIEKVTVFEGSIQGAVAVRFRAADDAERCVVMLDERSFGQGTVRCALYDGVTDYRAPSKRSGGVGGGQGQGQGQGHGQNGELARVGASGNDSSGSVEALEVQEKNLDAFADWLEADSTASSEGEEDD